jgi:hypothetical protein
MAKKTKRRLADDLPESIKEARDCVAGKMTGAIVRGAIAKEARA